MNIGQLVKDIKACQKCKEYLPLGARPILQVAENARVLIVGQAPGKKVHETGLPWNDKSGDTLRMWLSIDKKQFYNDNRIAIAPIGFCYPGKGRAGDKPPRPECAKLWRSALHHHLPGVELTLLIGRYAQNYYLKEKMKDNVTDTIKAYKEYLSGGFFPLIHPSPRNCRWHKQNEWFQLEIVPILREKIAHILSLDKTSASQFSSNV